MHHSRLICLSSCVLCLLNLAMTSSVTSYNDTVNTTTGICADECDCSGWPDILRCDDANFEDIQPLITRRLRILHFTDIDFDDDTLPPDLLENATALEEFYLIDCDIEYVREFDNRTTPLTDTLVKLVLHDNDIEQYYALTRLMQWWPSISHLDMSENEFTDLDTLVSLNEFHEITASLVHLNLSNSELESVPLIPRSVLTLDISLNEIDRLDDGWLNGSLQNLDASHNLITSITNRTFEYVTDMRKLDLHRNSIDEIHLDSFAELAQLKQLDLSLNGIADVWTAKLPDKVSHFNVSHNKLLYFNMTELSHLENIIHLDISYNDQLSIIFGSIFDIYHPGASTNLWVDLRSCALYGLPRYFFSKTGSTSYNHKRNQTYPVVLVEDNPLACDCQLMWVINRPDTFPPIEQEQTLKCRSDDEEEDEDIERQQITHEFIESLNLTAQKCSLGSSIVNNSIIRFKFGRRALVPCELYSESPVSIRWHVVYPGNVIAEWHELNETTEVYDPRMIYDDETDNMTTKFSILPGGTLAIKDMRAADIERYVCTIISHEARRLKRSEDTVFTSSESSTSVLIRVRIDYSHYGDQELWSYIIGVITCMIFFTLHMIWSGIRKFIIWRMEVSERTSRLKRVAAAMEKYRQRQIEAIQEKYARRMEQVRENYRVQAETLRQGYMNRNDRFRDYRATHMEAMTTHWDTLKDNYQLQMTHLRENYTGQVSR